MTNPLNKLSIETLQRRFDEANQNYESALQAFRAADEALIVARNKLTPLGEEISRRKISESDDIAFILNGTPDCRVTYDRYVELVTSYDLFYGGTWNKTNQRVIRLKMYRKDNPKNQLQIEGVKKFLDYIIPLPDDIPVVGGCKPIDIFEHTLSEYGHYTLYITPDNKGILEISNWGRVKYEELGDFDAAMKYIQKNHFYSTEEESYEGYQ